MNHVLLPYESTQTGRKEIVTFFYLYAVIELLALFLDSAIIPTHNAVYPVRPLSKPSLLLPFPLPPCKGLRTQEAHELLFLFLGLGLLSFGLVPA
jgi:hypothetical protein